MGTKYTVDNSGNLTLEGNASIGGDLTVEESAVIDGDLTVDGTIIGSIAGNIETSTTTEGLSTTSPGAVGNTLAAFNILGSTGITLTGYGTGVNQLVVAEAGMSPSAGPITKTNAVVTSEHDDDATAIAAVVEAVALNVSLTAFGLGGAGITVIPVVGTTLPSSFSPVLGNTNVYTFSAAVTNTGTTVTINGSISTIVIFQIPSALTLTDVNVVLTGGQLASNVFWQVGTSVTITNNDATNRIIPGTVISETSVATGAITVTSSAAGTLSVGRLISLVGGITVTQSGAGALTFQNLPPTTTTGTVVVSGALPPSTGQVLTATSATTAIWETPASASGAPGGSNHAIQYNNAGVFGGDNAITTNGSGTLTVANIASSSGITLTATYIQADANSLIGPDGSNFQINPAPEPDSANNLILSGGECENHVGGNVVIAGGVGFTGNGSVNLTGPVIVTGTITANLTGTASTTNALNSATTIVNVSSATAPSVGQSLIATGSTAAAWSSSSFVPDVIDSLGSSGSSLNINWANGLISTITLTASCTFTYSNVIAGQTMTFILTQGGSGSYTVTWPTTKWPSGLSPTLTTTVGKADFISIFFDGSTYYGFVGGQNY